MYLRLFIIMVFALLSFVSTAATLHAAESALLLEKSMSDTLDVWREGRYEQLFDMLAHRGKTSREKFVNSMQDAKRRPACCWQKMENFKVLNEKRTEATIYVKIGLEGVDGRDGAMTREFKLTHQEGVWKMQLADVMSIAGASSGKNRRNSR